jgi:hypothetical protein
MPKDNNKPKVRVMPVRDEPFSAADLDRACDELGMLEFFRPDLRAPVMRLLRDMCPHKRALRWLVEELVNHVGKWPGPAEVRGLLCSRFDPADGIDQWCSLPGYTAAEQEEKHLERHKQLKNAEGYVADESRDVIRLLGEGKKLS